MPDFKSVAASTWTSFNRLHTVNNMKTVDWSLQHLPTLTEQDIVLDFGCGTGESAAYIGSLHKYGSAQVIGLDINLDFIKYALAKFRKFNNVSYFWSPYLEDFKFLRGKVSVITCFCVLHILPEAQLFQAFSFFHDILAPGGRIVVLHYLGRTDEYFKASLDIHTQLQTKPRWKPYIKPQHKTFQQHRTGLETSNMELISMFNKNGYEAVDRQQAALRIIMNASTLKVILGNDMIRKMEFGKAYENIPAEMRDEFAMEYSQLLDNLTIQDNVMFTMAVFEVKK